MQWFQWGAHGHGVGHNAQTVCHLSVYVFCFLGRQCRQVELVAHAGKSRNGAFAGGVTYRHRSREVTVAGKQQCSFVLAVALVVIEYLLQFVVLTQVNLQLWYTALDGQSLGRSNHQQCVVVGVKDKAWSHSLFTLFACSFIAQNVVLVIFVYLCLTNPNAVSLGFASAHGQHILCLAGFVVCVAC